MVNRMQIAADKLIGDFKDYAAITITYNRGSSISVTGITASVGRTPYDIIDGDVMISVETRDYFVEKTDLVNGSTQLYPQQGDRIVDKADEFQIITMNEASGAMDVRFYHYFSGNDGIWITDSTDLPVGIVRHYVLTYDSSSVDNNPLMYFNGDSVTVTKEQAPTNTADNTANDLIIGNNSGIIRTLDGTIFSIIFRSGIKPPEWAKDRYETTRRL